MNYKESEEILKKVKAAKKILVNCHRGPDPDSIGSALAMRKILANMGKKVDVVCPTDIEESVSFLEGFEGIEKVDFDLFSFSEYDLFIVLDSSDWDQVLGDSENKPKIPVVVIDHHDTNTSYGTINLIDKDKVSTAEMLYLIFEDWGVKIDKKIAESLLAGLLSDSGVFRFPAVTAQTIEIGLELIKLGADKNKLIFHIYNSIEFERLKLWGEILTKLTLEEDIGLAWSATSYEELKHFKTTVGARETLASLLGGAIKDAKVSIIMTEGRKGRLSISIRRRSNIDVSKIALELGGGGHKAAAGAMVEGEFEDAVERVLEVARKHAKESK